MTEPITPDLPAPTKHAADIAKLTTGVAAAVASIWFPPAAIAAAVLPIVIDRYVNRPRDLLIRALERGEIRDVSAEQFAPFVPMAYKFMEAIGKTENRARRPAAIAADRLRQRMVGAVREGIAVDHQQLCPTYLRLAKTVSDFRQKRLGNRLLF
jgi:hypothetical protein